jgi:hypothetical protein
MSLNSNDESEENDNSYICDFGVPTAFPQSNRNYLPTEDRFANPVDLNMTPRTYDYEQLAMESLNISGIGSAADRAYDDDSLAHPFGPEVFGGARICHLRYHNNK